METSFKITAAEFDLGLFKKIEEWVKKNEHSEITISFKNELSFEPNSYYDSLKTSIQELSEDKSKTFTMEELNSYLNSHFSS